MNDETPRPRSSSTLRWGIPASVALHLVFAAVLFFELPFEMPAPQKEESVSVEIVPPPEEKKPEPPPPPEEEKKEEPPPPPKEEKKEEPPPPPPPKQEEKKAEPPPAAAEGQPPGGRVPIPVLRPVFAFGEKDSGPRKALDGNAAEEPAAKPPEEKPQVEPKPPAETAKPGAGDLAAETIAALEEAAPESLPEAESKPDAPAKADAPNDLPDVKTLFSTAITDNPVAKTAMGDMPRDERAAELCVTELREQLRRASPPYRPELLPSFALKTGTVLDVRNAAFRASARWHELRFRCELDADAMSVRSFAFAVGKEIPRSEWKSRGFPVF